MGLRSFNDNFKEAEGIGNVCISLVTKSIIYHQHCAELGAEFERR